jgi:replicative DNA helicase
MPSAPIAGSDRFARNAPGDAQIESLRLPPHSVEAEQAVLGGLLLSNQAWDRIGDLLGESDFYRHDHRLVWRVITKLVEDNKPADVLTVSEALKVAGELNDVGGLAYLHQLASQTPSAANIRRYAEIVRERSIMRRLAEVGTSIADSAYSPQGREAKQLLDEAETRILEIGESGGRSSESFQEMSKVLAEVMSRLDELHRNPNSVTGKATGYMDLDEMTTGLQDGDLIIVAGRPSMGKAQPVDARIKTPTGWTLMGDLRVGDRLASIDGEASTVTGIHPQGVKQVYRVAFDDGRATEACAEHLWRVYSEAWSGHRIASTELLMALVSDKRCPPLYIDGVSGNFGHEENLPVDAWALGALLGVGTMSGRDGVMVSMPAAPQMQQALPGRGLQPGAAASSRKLSAMEGPIATPLQEGLKALGLWGVASEAKFIPSAYRNAARHVRMALLHGLLGARAGRSASSFHTTSPRLAADVAEVVRSVGGWCRVQERVAHAGRAWRLEIALDRAPAIASITPTRRVQAQCISVSHPSRLYVTDDYVVTHNTSFALNIAEHVALELKLPVLVFSMEMGGTQLATRLLGSVGKVDAQALRTGRLSPTDWDRLGIALGKLNEAPLLIDETPALNPLELRARARRKWREYGALGLIVIDYIQLMQGSEHSSGENRATELSEISRGLKQMAKELQVPVIALSQLNRSLEQRPNKRPVMSDLRECVVGDTLVMLADGRRVPIRELVGTTPEVLAMSEDGKIIRAQSDAVWSVGKKQVFKVNLASGRSIRATAKHRMYGAKGWVEIGDLTVGDRLAIARQVPQPESVVRWKDEEVILLGHLVGDGSYLKHQPLRYATASEANSEAVTKAAQALGSEVKRYAGRGQWHQLLISGNGNRWHATGVGGWLKQLGIFGQRSHEKRLPQEAFQLADDQVALLLRHLWATDGSIVVRREGSKGSQRIYFSTSSLGLAHDVGALLLRFGIVARYRCSVKSGYRPCYAVDVSGHECQAVFLDQIGAFGPREAQAVCLKAYLDATSGNTNVDTLPAEAFLELKAEMVAQGISRRAMHRMRGTAYGGTPWANFSPSRQLIRAYARPLGGDVLRRWTDSDLFWDRVISIEPVGEEEIFDLTVPGPASWLADGVITHNSGALEQDADMIMFIYRDEVYNEDSPDKGMAEIIIGKQRNGPIGTVKLTFLGKHTRFENYSGAPGGGYSPGY